jgi:hypothetical protein
MHRTRHNISQWMPSASSLQYYDHPTTHFPVEAATNLIKTTVASRPSSNSKRSLAFASGVGSVPKVCVDEHEARSHSRAHSADTVVSASNANGALRRSVGVADRGDLVQQFVEHRRSKIRKYVTELSIKYPIPISCVVEASGRNSTKSRMLIQFACQTAGPHCVYSNPNRFFSLRTKIPAVWLHLMFLQQEAMNLAECGQVLTQGSEEFRVLDNCWSCLPKDVRNNRPFAALVTSAFPSVKVCKVYFLLHLSLPAIMVVSGAVSNAQRAPRSSLLRLIQLLRTGGEVDMLQLRQSRPSLVCKLHRFTASLQSFFANY